MDLYLAGIPESLALTPPDRGSRPVATSTEASGPTSRELPIDALPTNSVETGSSVSSTCWLASSSWLWLFYVLPVLWAAAILAKPEGLDRREGSHEAARIPPAS
jgi:hypothetical protein